ncbi:testis-specific serine/threonine-protein kinase 5-like [Sciurus carolinensis]|uniref:testis-specific serine/threonine-protein kinase 5-like n=1 Tax=Sciurus carolinensis TaxID=30640 RepID=UPI001FB3E338|nr:testis-specific serine/threonine-protein kinase 5-like [Sciurus carolinensis]
MARPHPHAVPALIGRRYVPQARVVRRLRPALGPAPGRRVRVAPDCWTRANALGARGGDAGRSSAAGLRTHSRSMRCPRHPTHPEDLGRRVVASRRTQSQRVHTDTLPHPLTEPGSELDRQAPFGGTLSSMKGSGRLRSDHRNFIEQVQECMDNGYLLSSKRIGSGAFSKVYLAYATQERMQHNPKLSSDLRGKHHTMVAIKIISMAEAPVEFSQKFLPREISSLNATYKHLNVVQLYETYHNSQRFYLVLELAARGDLLEHINAVSDHRCCPGLEEEEARRLFWQLVGAVAHCHNAGIVHRDLKCENILLDDQGFLKLTDFGFANHSGLKNSLLSTFCGSVAYTAPEILMSKKYSGEQADLWSLGIILYAMVTGKLPFKESQPHRMLHLMRRGPIFQPGLSPECQDLIRGLLHLRPRARLDLQQVAAHRWMLPAVRTLFRSVLGATSDKKQVLQGWGSSAPKQEAQE